MALPQKSFSFTPGFSPVERHSHLRNRFNGFIENPGKTVETVFCQCLMFSTGLKPGVNETTFEAKRLRMALHKK